VIAPHADLVPDAELSAMAPDGVSIHATRVRFAAMDADPELGGPVELVGLQAYLRPPHLDDAAALLAGGPVSVIAYAFTSTGYLGTDGDEVLRARLEQRTGGVPVVTTCTAAVQAMRSLGVERIGLIHPPWISGELNAMGAAYFRGQGVDVRFASPAVLAGGQHNIQPGDVYQWVRANVPDDVDAVFFGGNGFRVVGVIERLERDLQRPVLSANQVLFWAALHAAGVTDMPVAGYGRLLAENPMCETFGQSV
jgi:maleate isomerase